MAHPEDRVLDKIDELVNTQLAEGVDYWGNPLDDYHADRYPKCACGCDWHGLECDDCGCPQYQEPLPELHRKQAQRQQRRDIDHRVVVLEGGQEQWGRGYTLADLEAMRWRREREGQWSDYPQRYVLGEQQPLIRLWRYNPETWRLEMVEAQVLTVEWHQGGGVVRLGWVRTGALNIEELVGGPAADGRVAVERGTPDGFVYVGSLDRGDLEIEHTVDEVVLFGGDVMRTHDSYTARFAVTDDALLRRLFGHDAS